MHIMRYVNLLTYLLTDIILTGGRRRTDGQILQQPIQPCR